MTKFWFIILSQILAAAIVFYTTDNVLPSRKKGEIFRPKRQFILTNKGIALSAIFIFIIGLSIWQEVDDSMEKRNIKNANDLEIARRDSIANAKQDYRDSLAAKRLEQKKVALNNIEPGPVHFLNNRI